MAALRTLRWTWILSPAENCSYTIAIVTRRFLSRFLKVLDYRNFVLVVENIGNNETTVERIR